jgi:hypothetical protein
MAAPFRRLHRRYAPEEEREAKAKAPASEASERQAEPGGLDTLSSSLGNQAMQRLLQREAAPARDGQPVLLTNDQVQRAFVFYSKQQYSNALIRQMQAVVGARQTGTVSREFILAVARYQAQHPPLAVDGMVGPRTLPAVFRQGLDNRTAQEGYMKRVEEIVAQWEMLDPQGRIDAFLKAANEQLDQAKVPACVAEIYDGFFDPDLYQDFDFEEWAIRFPGGMVNPKPDEDVPMPHMIGHLVFRGARHAEQWYAMARLAASFGMNGEAIARDMKIPVEIANRAAGEPFDRKDPARRVAYGWADSIYGQMTYNSRVRERYLAAVDAWTKADEAYRANPSEENRRRRDAAQAELQEARQAYQNLPEVQDADRIANNLEEVRRALGDED